MRISAEGSYSTGNNQRLLGRFKTDYEYADSLMDADLGILTSYGEQSSVKTDQDWFGGLNLQFVPANSLRPFILGNIESSFQRRIAYRYQAGLGAEYTFIRDSAHLLKFSAAFLQDNTKLSEQELSSRRISFRLKGFIIFPANGLRLFLESYLQPSAYTISDTRLRTIFTAEFPITKSFTLRSTTLHTYENIIAPGRLRNDLSITFGFGIVLR
jgi:hypothetical protein